MNDIEGIIQGLLDDDLTESAEKICTLCISSSQFSGNESKLLELHGDCFFALEQYVRALNAYQQARNPSFSTNIEGNESQKNVQTVDNIDAARILFKQCQCMMKTGDTATALREMESVPRSLRTTKMNVFLGRLYKTSGLRRHAIAALQEVIRANPFAIECAELLISLGVNSADADGLFEPSLGFKESNATLLHANAIIPVVTGLSALQSSNYEGAETVPHHNNAITSSVPNVGCKQHFQSALTAFPSSVYLHTRAALAAYAAEKEDTALTHFRRVRQLDRHCPTGMATFATILQGLCVQGEGRTERTNDGYEEELSLLASDLLAGCPRQSAAWVAAALYTDLKGDRDKAMTFIDKGCKMEPRSPYTFVVKGRLFLSRDQPEQASIAFSQSNSIEKNAEAFLGITDCHLAMGKYNDALLSAKTALKLRPKSSQCFAHLGRVIAKSDTPTGRKEAARAYDKAIRLNPLNWLAVLELADLLLAQNKFEEAADYLKAGIDRIPSYALRCRYGKVLGQLGRCEEAVQILHLAASTGPAGADVSAAVQELDNIESCMRCPGASEGEYSNDSGYMAHIHSNDGYESPS